MAKSQSKFQEKKEQPSSSEDAAPPSKKPRFSYDPEVKGEAMTPIRLYDQPPQLILDYLDGDIFPIALESKIEARTKYYAQFKLFGRSLHDMMKDEASILANLILHGEEKDIEEVLKIVKKKPILLHVETEARDPLLRPISGTLLQIAAMAGDVNFKSGIQDEKEQGVVERLIAAGDLSKEETADQLQCLVSKKAIEENENRNQRILASIKRFGEGITETKADKNMSFEAYQIRCKSLIDQLEKDLQPDIKTVITTGYVFDPKILHIAAKWFEDNVGRFGGWWSVQSDVFWVNGFGKLQSKLSSRDAQVTRAGIGYLVDDGVVPGRTLNNSDKTSYFFNSSSRLGVDFYLGYYGGGVRVVCLRPSAICGRMLLENLCRAKTAALQNLCNIQTIQMNMHA